jgi:hypothetical protein
VLQDSGAPTPAPNLSQTIPFSLPLPPLLLPLQLPPLPLLLLLLRQRLSCPVEFPDSPPL